MINPKSRLYIFNRLFYPQFIYLFPNDFYSSFEVQARHSCLLEAHCKCRKLVDDLIIYLLSFDQARVFTGLSQQNVISRVLIQNNAIQKIIFLTSFSKLTRSHIVLHGLQICRSMLPQNAQLIHRSRIVLALGYFDQSALQLLTKMFFRLFKCPILQLIGYALDQPGDGLQPGLPFPAKLRLVFLELYQALGLAHGPTQPSLLLVSVHSRVVTGIPHRLLDFKLPLFDEIFSNKIAHHSLVNRREHNLVLMHSQYLTHMLGDVDAEPGVPADDGTVAGIDIANLLVFLAVGRRVTLSEHKLLKL